MMRRNRDIDYKLIGYLYNNDCLTEEITPLLPYIQARIKTRHMLERDKDFYHDALDVYCQHAKISQSQGEGV
jgi:hypothetical protein